MNTKQENLSVDTSEKKNKLVRKSIILLNWVFLISLISSVLAIIIYSFVYPDRSIPSIFTDISYLTLGWFGGSLVSFWYWSR
jgi:hypothetical protein